MRDTKEILKSVCGEKFRYTTRAVFSALIAYSDDDGYVLLPLASLPSLSGCSAKGVRQSLVELEDMGYIVWVQHKVGWASYRIQEPV